MNSEKRLKGLYALITGASRGLGAAVAERFAQEGANLILIARSIKDLERLDDQLSPYNIQTTLVPFDLKHHSKISMLAAEIYKKFKRLDILIGNAAILGTLGPIAHTCPSVWNEVIATNLTANYHLIRAFDPLLRQSPSGRAVFVTSSAVTKQPCAYWSAYATSKAGLEHLVKTYAQEVVHTYPHLKVNLICPGEVQTRLRREAMPGEALCNLEIPSKVTEHFLALADPDCTLHGQILAL